MSQARTVFVSDALVASPVEGAQVIASELAQHLKQVHGATVLGPDPRVRFVDDALSVTTPSLRSLIAMRRLAPERVVFLPAHGVTLPALLRATMLWIAARRPALDLVVLQDHGRALEHAARFAPDAWSFVVATNEQGTTLSSKGRQFRLLHPRIPSAKASSHRTRAEARSKLGLGPDPIFLHVGHPRHSRNLRALDRLAEYGQLLLVMSPYAAEEPDAVPQGANVTVIRERRDDLCDLYKAANVYVFPTAQRDGVIGTPLSIFEALANGTPVVARRSAATERWADLAGLTLVDSDEELVEAARAHDCQATFPILDVRTCSGDLAVCQ